jgi:hypothetical protein
MDEKSVLSEARSLYKLCSSREGKYIRNKNRYNNNGARREDLWSPNQYPLAYAAPAVNAQGSQTQFNLSKSCVDTVCSKISQSAVRPFFNPLNGDYDTRQVCKELQHYFDIWLDEHHAFPKSYTCMRNAAIFDLGVMQIWDDGPGLSAVPPYEYFLDPAEYEHKAVTRVMRWQKHYPIAAVVGQPGNRKTDNQKILKKFEQNPYLKGEYLVFYDLYQGYRYDFFEANLVSEPKKLDFSMYGGLYRRPFVEIYYNRPISGLFSTSLIDDIYPVQRQVDEIVNRLDVATRQSGLQWAFIPEGSGLKSSTLENGVNVYTFTPGPDGGAPIVVNPDPISNQYIQLLEMYIQKTYSLNGISELSAQSKAPRNLDSGKALETLEDIESDRFNMQLQQFVHFLVDVARVCIDVLPEKDRLLPKKIGRSNITWGDVRKSRDLFSIQFSAASALSKDPEQKMSQIDKMYSMGLIDKAMIADLMDMPDLERAESLASSSYNNCQKIISNAIKTGSTDYLPTVDIELLKSLSVRELNILQSNEDDQAYIDNLSKLVIKVVDDAETLKKIALPADEQAGPPPDPSAQMMEPGQAAQLLGFVKSLNLGEIDENQFSTLLKLVYPTIDESLVSGLIKSPPADPALQERGSYAFTG